jgi:hypothetical protein
MTDPDGGALDAVLRAAGTVRRDPAADQRLFADVWDRIEASIDDDTATTAEGFRQRRLDLIADRDATARRRRRAARVASVTLAVVVAGAGTAAAAEFLATRTGEHNSGWEVGAGGSGEIFDRSGTNLRRVVEEATADIRFAPGYDTERAAVLDRAGAPDPGTAISESHLRSDIAGAAVCTWADAWVAADHAGDVAARAQTAETLTEAVTWEPFLTFATDHQEPTPADSPPEASYRWWLLPLAQAAAAGDRQAVFDVVADSHACGPEVIPVIDADPAYRWHGVR